MVTLNLLWIAGGMRFANSQGKSTDTGVEAGSINFRPFSSFLGALIPE